jgi:nucleoside-diphosphate-sugar epimerase
MEVDQIYHLACPASPPHYQYNPIKTIKTSVMGTLNMLGLAKRVNARLLFTSTSEVYGDPIEHPQKETYWYVCMFVCLSDFGLLAYLVASSCIKCDHYIPIGVT